MTSTTFFFVFIPLLAIILLAVNLIFAPHNPYQEKDSTFECGFHSFLGQNRTQFSISFFIFALLFLLFDLEILLVYPYVVSAYANGIYGLMVMLIFFLALTLGFAFELGKNALKIDSRQMLTFVSPKNTSILVYISGFNQIFSKLFKYFTMERIIAGLISLSLIILLRYTIYGGFSTNPLKWWEGFTVGIPAIFIRLGINGIIDWILIDLGYKDFILDIWNGPVNKYNYGLLIKSATPIDNNNLPWSNSSSGNVGNSKYTHVSSGHNRYVDLNSFNSYDNNFTTRNRYAGTPVQSWIHLVENNFANRNSKFGFPFWLYRPDDLYPRSNPISPEPANFVNINKPDWDTLKQHIQRLRALEYQYRTVSNDTYKDLKIISISWKALYKHPNKWTTEENLCVNEIRQMLNYNGDNARDFQMQIRNLEQTLYARLDYANLEEDKANLISIDILKETEDFIKANPTNSKDASIYFGKLLFYFPKPWNCSTPISDPNAPGLNIIPPGCSAYPPTLDIMVLDPNASSLNSNTPSSTTSDTPSSTSNTSNSNSKRTDSNRTRRPRGSSSSNSFSNNPRRQHQVLIPSKLNPNYSSLKPNASSLNPSSSNLNTSSLGLNAYASSSTANPPSYDIDSTRWGLNGTGLINDSRSSTPNPTSYDSNPLGLNSNRLGYNTNPLGLNSDNMASNSDNMASSSYSSTSVSNSNTPVSNSNTPVSNSNRQSRTLYPAPSGLNNTSWGLNSNNSVSNETEKRIANSNRRFKRRR